VIVFTSANENRDLEESYKLGASSYILKPIDLHQFSDVIKIIGDYWAIVTEPPRLDGCIAK
jgi:response regulator of citrate/malate metabolism